MVNISDTITENIIETIKSMNLTSGDSEINSLSTFLMYKIRYIAIRVSNVLIPEKMRFLLHGFLFCVCVFGMHLKLKRFN